MNRRRFLERGSAAAAGVGALRRRLPGAQPPSAPIPRRPLGKTGERVSILCFGGTAVMSVEQSYANNLVAEAFDRGINYFDVSPTYGSAEERLGPALAPYRKRCFLASKTDSRDRAGVERDLEKSLDALRTDHLDLYQHHALQKLAELDVLFGPNGAMEGFEKARKDGKVRFLGFSAHSVEVALEAIRRAHFDVVLFPTNYVLFSKANFGPTVLDKVRSAGAGYVALKAMARGKYPADWTENRRTPLCWYEPCGLPAEASLALRWTLSQPVDAAIPPGNPAWFRLAMDVAQGYRPVTAEESRQLLTYAGAAEPLFQLGA